jgi:predicted transcriptional regulator of viral defense system
MKRTEPRFVVCVKNKGYAASLELRKIYQAVPDQAAAKLHHIRVIDESGEDARTTFILEVTSSRCNFRSRRKEQFGAQLVPEANSKGRPGCAPPTLRFLCALGVSAVKI